MSVRPDVPGRSASMVSRAVARTKVPAANVDEIRTWEQLRGLSRAVRLAALRSEALAMPISAGQSGAPLQSEAAPRSPEPHSAIRSWAGWPTDDRWVRNPMTAVWSMGTSPDRSALTQPPRSEFTPPPTTTLGRPSSGSAALAKPKSARPGALDIPLVYCIDAVLLILYEQTFSS